MITFRKLDTFDRQTFCEVAQGYSSFQIYRVEKTESDEGATFGIVLENRSEQFVKDWQQDPSDFALYERTVAEQGLSMGAFDGDRLIGLAVAERREWNRSLWIWEFHIHPDYRRRGIGKLLMDQMAEVARQAGLSRMICETQNTNVDAVRFYRAVGFKLAGIDCSLYPPEIREIAFFMSRTV